MVLIIIFVYSLIISIPLIIILEIIFKIIFKLRFRYSTSFVKIIEKIYQHKMKVYFFCVIFGLIATWELQFDSPLYSEIRAKAYVTEILHKKYDDSYKVENIKKNISNQVGGTNFIVAYITNDYDLNKYEAQCYLSDYGLSFEYVDDSIDDYIFSNMLSDVLRTNSSLNEISCSFDYFHLHDKELVISNDTKFQEVLLNNKVNASVNIYDFYNSGLNYNRLFIIAEELRKLNFKNLYIDYYRYPLESKETVDKMLNENTNPYGNKSTAKKINFSLDEIKDVKNTDEFTKILVNKSQVH